MLFARFLAENQLLIEPSSGLSISLDECEELATEEGTDLWALAAQYAQAMLPQIFRTDDPVLATKLPLEIRQQLQGLVAGLETETFTASDSLGWTYQFWQTKRKKEVNDSGVKIGADELSPVTQLFTEDYMVDFLLDNTLGAWHAGKVLAANPQLASTAQSEDDLRQAVALPGCPWTYLRFVKTDDGRWAPASGSFDGWPRTAASLKCLDPCMGSGHFVVAMFERMVALRIEEEGASEQAAVAAVIKGNLFGLEIDPRCTQIAAFNLALAAWRRVGHYKLPSMNLACSGLAPNAREADWLAISGDNERLRNGMERLYRLFQKAAVLGSLNNPRAGEGDLLVAAFHELQPLLEKALAQETKDDTAHEMAVTARGLAKAAEMLAGQFTLVATNVPYLGRGKQDDVLMDYCEQVHPEAKADLATCFVERCLDFSNRGGSIALVTPQNWLFQSGFQRLRVRLLNESQWSGIAKLGTKAFQGIGGEVVTVALAMLCRESLLVSHCFFGLDVGSCSTPGVKAEALASNFPQIVRQEEQHGNPESRIAFDTRDIGTSQLGDYCECYQGVVTGDISRWVLKFWEVNELDFRLWSPCRAPSAGNSPFDGQHDIIRWEQGKGQLHDYAVLTRDQLHDMHESGNLAWGRSGVVINRVKTLRAGLYYGEIYHNSVAAIVPKDQELVHKVWAFCNSPSFEEEVRRLSPALGVTNRVLIQIPFNPDEWEGDLPKPLSSDPTQWVFSGHPAGTDQLLHVAVARLVGYQWPRQTGSSFPDCPALGPDGLEALADDDGIVCLAPVRGEASAVERLRKLLAAALGEEWSSAKERELLLASAVDNNAKKPELDLESWLRSSFSSEHCKLFQSRPFIWQVCDGNPHGFSALVNYHKLAAPNGQGRKTLELLAYTYLGDWIDRQMLDQAEGINGADDRLAAALDFQGELKKILEGEPPYDLFVRWKPLHHQAIGWDPDINDGVRMNIRPFLNAQLRKGGKTGAGILRAKPGTMKWTKDRGKEPMRSKEEFPWFWGWDENDHVMATDFGALTPGSPPTGESFDGNRWNDLHYSRAAKKAARAQHRGEG